MDGIKLDVCRKLEIIALKCQEMAGHVYFTGKCHAEVTYEDRNFLLLTFNVLTHKEQKRKRG